MKKKKSFWQSILDFLGDSSPFMTLVGKAAMLVVLNVCCLLCCLPVVTAGAAVTALYAVLLEREEHSYLSAPAAFFRQLRRRFRQATVLWLPFLILALLLGMEAWVLLVRQLTDHALLLTPLLVAAALWAMTLLWLFPLLARGHRRAALHRFRAGPSGALALFGGDGPFLRSFHFIPVLAQDIPGASAFLDSAGLFADGPVLPAAFGAGPAKNAIKRAPANRSPFHLPLPRGDAPFMRKKRLSKPVSTASFSHRPTMM